MKWIDEPTTITLPLIPLVLIGSHGHGYLNANDHDVVWQIVGEMINLPPHASKHVCKHKFEFNFPAVEEVMQMKLHQNSDQVLNTLFRMYWRNIDDVLLLIGAFPAILRATTSDGVLPIHLIAEKCSFDTVMKNVLEGMKQGLQFGGLSMKNRNGESPLAILSARITSSHRRNRRTYIDEHKWSKFCILIQIVAMKYIYKDDYYTIQSDIPLLNSLLMPSLLHSALIIGCPIYIINQILHDKSINIDFTDKDALGRTAMEIAASNISTDGSVILKLLKAYPRASSEMDANGDLLLHQVLKHGKKTLPNYLGGDVYFIGSIVQENPDSLVVLDNSLKMYPFTIACMKSWSLEVVYALLRTNPFVIES
jgi:hypothetical protein